MTFKLKSGNASTFKNLGSSPAKQKPGGSVGEALEHHKKYKAKKSMPKNFNTTGSSKAGKFAKVAKNVLGKAGRFLGGKTLGIAGMMMATSSKADQPKKGKGKIEYPGGKMDFSKKK